jgi:hypothetical protein
MHGITLLVIAVAVGTAACASESTWRGEIGDSACRADHLLDEHANILTPRDCALDCVARGAKFVLVSDGSVFALENQDHPGLKELAGQPVQLSGHLEGDTIRMTSIEKSLSRSP